MLHSPGAVHAAKDVVMKPIKSVDTRRGLSVFMFSVSTTPVNLVSWTKVKEFDWWGERASHDQIPHAGRCEPWKDLIESVRTLTHLWCALAMRFLRVSLGFF